MNKFIMCIVPQSYLYETFCRPPAPGLGNCPPLLYCSSQLPTLPRSFSGGVPSDISEQWGMEELWWEAPTTTPPSPQAPPARLFASSPAPWSRSLSSGVPPSWSQNNHVSQLTDQMPFLLLSSKLEQPPATQTPAPCRWLR